VDTALTAYQYATEQESLQRRAVAVAQRAAEVARAQLLAGTVDVTTVLQAFTDVDTALTAYQYATEQESLQRRAVAVAQRAAEVARAQLLAGTVDVTTVLQAQTTLYTAQDTLAQVRLTRFQSLLNLYKALGGGWPLGALAIPPQGPGTIAGGVALPVGGNVH